MNSSIMVNANSSADNGSSYMTLSEGTTSPTVSQYGHGTRPELSSKNTTNRAFPPPPHAKSSREAPTETQIPPIEMDTSDSNENDINSHELGHLNEEKELNSELDHRNMKPVPDHTEISVLREIVFIGLIATTQILTQASLAQTVTPFVIISRHFHVDNDAGEISWFTAAYSLTVGTFILIAGKLGDLHGYKRVYLLGYIWFGLWSLIAGFSNYSKSAIFFDVCRALQGMGPAFTMPNALALIGHYYPESKRKNIIMCIFGAVAPGGFVIGAFLSNIFARFAWWPWMFWTNGMVCFALAIIGFLVIPKNIGSINNESMDYIGSILIICGLVLFNFSWNQGPVVGWDKPYVYILLIIGVLCFILFFLFEKRVKNPLIPPNVFNGDTGFILGCIAAGWSCFGVWLYYYFQYNNLVKHLPLMLQATRYIPPLFVGIFAALTTGALLDKIPTSIVMLIAMLAFITGSALMATRARTEIYWGEEFFALLITPCGMDISFPAGTVLLSNKLPKHQQGIAASLIVTVVNYSISIGLGIAGTVQYYVTKNDPRGDLVKGLRSAMYTGIGLAGFGVLLAVAFVLKQFRVQILDFFHSKGGRKRNDANDIVISAGRV